MARTFLNREFLKLFGRKTRLFFFVTNLGGNTNTDQALNLARTRLFTLSNGARSGVSKVSLMYEGVVSKETVVLRRWGSSIQKFGFINGVDKCKLATVQRF